MIVFFGPAGAGKSVQGQILAARNGWRWLSAGQLLRDTRDIDVLKVMQTGALVDPATVNRIMREALVKAGDIERVILDGYPRELDQAKWLVNSKTHHGRDINLVMVLEVPRSEIMQRLRIRGRADDTPEAIDRRINIYQQEIYPLLSYFSEQGIKIAHIDGTGTVGQVHDRIMEELAACKLA